MLFPVVRNDESHVVDEIAVHIYDNQEENLLVSNTD